MKIIAQKTLASGLRILFEMDETYFKKLSEHYTNAMEKATIASGELMLSQWQDQARSSLKSSVSYTRALQEGNHPRYNGDPLWYNITQGQRTRDKKRSIGVILEEGIEPFDMKEKILKGRKFVKVRFEYGSSNQSHSQKLSSEIEKVAKRYNRYLDDSRGLQQSQVREMYGDEAANSLNPKKEKSFTALTLGAMKGAPAKANIFQLDKPIEGVGWKQDFGRKVFYQWRTREFTGMVGDQTKSGKEIAVHTYSVYRTISKKSANDSWVHPGIRPRKILETAGHIAFPKIRQIFESALENAANSLN
jgi:hypothetical protein